MNAKVLRAQSRRGRSDRLRVGVTLFVRDENQTLWENGIFQNCFFLIEMLKASPQVEWCCIVVDGPGAGGHRSQFSREFGADVIGVAEALDSLDVIVELSAQLDVEWGKTFVDRGGRIAAMRVANDFIIDAERMAFKLAPGLLMSGMPYQEVWTLPAFERTCARYYEAGLRAPVRIMQHLWSPQLVDREVASCGRHTEFRYVPGRSRWRAAILEPNICSVKTAHIPLLACENAYRRNPAFLDVLRVFNTAELRNNQIFIRFARSLTLIKNGMASFEDRFPIFDIMGSQADVIVSHQWENAQNYLYYEALYGGFPLIHNSTLIEGCGYRYEDFDPEDGGAALLQAFVQHDLDLETYIANGRRLIAKLDPTSDANVRAYSEAIAGLFDDRRGAGAGVLSHQLAPAL
ncbi:DUF2827 domain-containing protein [Methylobacterium persicinum]|uniref:DUF2827 domain-containing protein n=1 Tax=Methylobacterium persicinum TaxID=374426 RepID=A0ABU0HSA7_9HYPH|nr:DUF2827 domain-containing protein [Methylobacterium persicinum]MDQ0445191.1 hypothetical protein [Methylobacterium persicinum]